MISAELCSPRAAFAAAASCIVYCSHTSHCLSARDFHPVRCLEYAAQSSHPRIDFVRQPAIHASNEYLPPADFKGSLSLTNRAREGSRDASNRTKIVFDEPSLSGMRLLNIRRETWPFLECATQRFPIPIDLAIPSPVST